MRRRMAKPEVIQASAQLDASILVTTEATYASSETRGAHLPATWSTVLR